MEYTEHSYLTDDELIAKVQNKSDATPLELELASRLQDALDGLEDAEDIMDGMADILESNGIEFELVEGTVQ